MARIFADSDGPCKGDSCLLEEDLQRSPTPGVMRQVSLRTKTSSVRHLQQPCTLSAAPWSLLWSGAQHAPALMWHHAYQPQLLEHFAVLRMLSSMHKPLFGGLGMSQALVALLIAVMLFGMGTVHHLAACTCLEDLGSCPGAPLHAQHVLVCQLAPTCVCRLPPVTPVLACAADRTPRQ